MQQAAVGHPLDCHPKTILEFFLNKEKKLIWTLNTSETTEISTLEKTSRHINNIYLFLTNFSLHIHIHLYNSKYTAPNGQII